MAIKAASNLINSLYIVKQNCLDVGAGWSLWVIKFGYLILQHHCYTSMNCNIEPVYTAVD